MTDVTEESFEGAMRALTSLDLSSYALIVGITTGQMYGELEDLCGTRPDVRQDIEEILARWSARVVNNCASYTAAL